MNANLYAAGDMSFLFKMCEGTSKFMVILLYSHLHSHPWIHGVIHLPRSHSHLHSHLRPDIWKPYSVFTHALPLFVAFGFAFAFAFTFA